MLTSRQAFKAAFINQCIDEGLSTEQMLKKAQAANAAFGEVEKKAIGGSIVGPVASAGTELAKSVWGIGAPLALAAPPIAGGVAGYLGAKATDIDEQDTEAVQARELIDEYRRLAARAERQQAAKTYRKKRESTGRMF